MTYSSTIMNPIKFQIIIVLFFINISLGYGCIIAKQDIGNNFTVGKNYDWYYSHGVIYVNKRNVLKYAIKTDSSSNELSWVSLYASVTFNQHGRELPIGGINEKGLIVESLLLEDSEYPRPNNKKTTNELQWIQYQLDNFKTIDQVVNGLKYLTVVPVQEGLHYYICDSTKECATIEFIEEEIVVKRDISILANNTYHESYTERSNYVGFGGIKQVPSLNLYSTRFIRLSNYIKILKTPLNIALNKVTSTSEEFATRWQIFYYPKTKQISFNLHKTGKNIKISLNTFDLSCEHDIALNLEIKGQKTHFSKYSKKMNKQNILKSFKRYEDEIPKELIDMIIDLPNKSRCSIE